ncbi:hypothetical protein GW17_00040061 [Ensete ventricosum]|nr:hypothetical protein GW17_00040061 [Ensete ventricosum]
MPAGGRACWRLPLQGALAMAGHPLAGGLGRSRLLLTTGLAVGGRPYMGAGRGWPPLLLVACENAARTRKMILRDSISSHAI